MDWSRHFPALARENEKAESETPPPRAKQVEIADIGCGFGGLLVSLSPLLPDTLMIGHRAASSRQPSDIGLTTAGMELRTQVLDYVINRIAALRSQNRPQPPISNSIQSLGPYENISALRTNTMKFLPNYFLRAQLAKIFLCFPDPHFKQRKHKARIVSAQLNAEYAYVLRPGGKVYTITDVEELYEWIVTHFGGREAGDVKELWERVSDDELNEDVCVKIMSDETEEGKKVSRNRGKKFIAVWRRRQDPEWP